MSSLTKIHWIADPVRAEDLARMVLKAALRTGELLYPDGSGEVERLRGINSELVRDYNALLVEVARRDATPSSAASAIRSAQAALVDAQRAFDTALGIARRDEPA